MAHTILPWQEATAGKGDANCEAADGSTIQNGNIDANAAVWVIKDNEKSSNPYWNGDVGSFVFWSNAHPYAIYEYKAIDSEPYNQLATARDQLITILTNATNRTPLITDANQFTCNYPASNDGDSYPALIDGNGSTYFHSGYGNEIGNGEEHYLQVNLGKAVSSFSFYSKMRNNGNNRPTEIELSGSNDPEGTFTPIITLSENRLIEKDDFQSLEINSATPYQYLRFTIKKTNTGTRFFTYSEFQVYEHDSYKISNELVTSAKEILNTMEYIQLIDIIDIEKYNKMAEQTASLNKVFTQINESYDVLAEIANSYYFIYHTDENGTEHYLQIAPDGTLSLTTIPAYSFQITRRNSTDGEGNYADHAYYLTMNGYRLSYWNGSNFNTNEIETNDVHCEGLWHCQAIYHNPETNKYAIRSTNAISDSYDVAAYFIYNNGLTSSTSEPSIDRYQWEIRGGYPINLSPDASDPNAYAIKSGRTNEDKELLLSAKHFELNKN